MRLGGRPTPKKKSLIMRTSVSPSECVSVCALMYTHMNVDAIRTHPALFPEFGPASLRFVRVARKHARARSRLRIRQYDEINKSLLSSMT